MENLDTGNYFINIFPIHKKIAIYEEGKIVSTPFWKRDYIKPPKLLKLVEMEDFFQLFVNSVVKLKVMNIELDNHCPPGSPEDWEEQALEDLIKKLE